MDQLQFAVKPEAECESQSESDYQLKSELQSDCESEHEWERKSELNEPQCKLVPQFQSEPASGSQSDKLRAPFKRKPPPRMLPQNGKKNIKLLSILSIYYLLLFNGIDPNT